MAFRYLLIPRAAILPESVADQLSFVKGLATHFNSLEKKQAKGNIYSVKLNKGNRMVFIVYKDKQDNHSKLIYLCAYLAGEHDQYEQQIRVAYDEVKKRGAAWLADAQEFDLENLPEAAAAAAVPKMELGEARWEYDYLENFIHLTDDQGKIIESINPPAWVVGCPGSGKTVLASVFMLREAAKPAEEVAAAAEPKKKILYLAPTKFLTDQMQKQCTALGFNEAIDYKTLADFRFEEGRTRFDNFVKLKETQVKNIDPNLLYEEFRVIATLGIEEYQIANYTHLAALEKDKLVTLFQAYWQSDGLNDSNIRITQAPLNPTVYSHIVIDEAQLCPLVFLQWLNQSTIPIVLLGDPYQMTRDVSMLSLVRLPQVFPNLQTYQLTASYRIPSKVAECAERVLTARAAQFKLPTLGAAKAVKSAKKIDGRVECVLSKSVNNETYKGATVAVVYFHPKDKDDLLKLGFSDGRLFTPDEIQGLEYPTVILWQPDRAWPKSIGIGYDKHEALTHISELLAYNRLFVAVTRAQMRLVYAMSRNTERSIAGCTVAIGQAVGESVPETPEDSQKIIEQLIAQNQLARAGQLCQEYLQQSLEAFCAAHGIKLPISVTAVAAITAAASAAASSIPLGKCGCVGTIKGKKNSTQPENSQLYHHLYVDKQIFSNRSRIIHYICERGSKSSHPFSTAVYTKEIETLCEIVRHCHFDQDQIPNGLQHFQQSIIALLALHCWGIKQPSPQAFDGILFDTIATKLSRIFDETPDLNHKLTITEPLQQMLQMICNVIFTRSFCEPTLLPLLILALKLTVHFFSGASTVVVNYLKSTREIFINKIAVCLNTQQNSLLIFIALWLLGLTTATLNNVLKLENYRSISVKLLSFTHESHLAEIRVHALWLLMNFVTSAIRAQINISIEIRAIKKMLEQNHCFKFLVDCFDAQPSSTNYQQALNALCGWLSFTPLIVEAATLPDNLVQKLIDLLLYETSEADVRETAVRILSRLVQIPEIHAQFERAPECVSRLVALFTSSTFSVVETAVLTLHDLAQIPRLQPEFARQLNLVSLLFGLIESPSDKIVVAALSLLKSLLQINNEVITAQFIANKTCISSLVKLLDLHSDYKLAEQKAVELLATLTQVPALTPQFTSAGGSVANLVGLLGKRLNDQITNQSATQVLVKVKQIPSMRFQFDSALPHVITRLITLWKITRIKAEHATCNLYCMIVLTLFATDEQNVKELLANADFLPTLQDYLQCSSPQEVLRFEAATFLLAVLLEHKIFFERKTDLQNIINKLYQEFPMYFLWANADSVKDAVFSFCNSGGSPIKAVGKLYKIPAYKEQMKRFDDIIKMAYLAHIKEQLKDPSAFVLSCSYYFVKFFPSLITSDLNKFWLLQSWRKYFIDRNNLGKLQRFQKYFPDQAQERLLCVAILMAMGKLAEWLAPDPSVISENFKTELNNSLSLCQCEMLKSDVAQAIKIIEQKSVPLQRAQGAASS